LLTFADFLLGLVFDAFGAWPFPNGLTLFCFLASASGEAFGDLTDAIVRRCTDKSPTFRIHREMNRAQLLGATVAAVNGQAALSG
jgi:hypothetical protein